MAALRSSHRRDGALLLLVGAFLTFRVFVLLLGVESLYHAEELHYGTVAKELLSGLRLPLVEYRLDDNHGASIITGIFAVPWFLLLGPNVIALKLVSLTVALGSFVLLYRLCHRHFGARTAVLAATLVICCPPMYTRLSMVILGHHGEAVFLVLMVLTLFYDMAFANRIDARRCVALGLIAGFGLWYTPITAVALLSCVVYWMAFAPTLLSARQVGLILAAFVIGVSPWIVLTASGATDGLSLFPYLFRDTAGAAGLMEALLRVPARAGKLLLAGLPLSLFFEDVGPLPGWVLSYGYAAVAGLGLVWLLRARHRKIFEGSAETPLILYVVLFVLGYALTSITIPNRVGHAFSDYRSLIALYVALLMLLARGLDVMWERRKAVGLASVLVGLGLVGNLQLVWLPVEFGRGLSYRGLRIGISSPHSSGNRSTRRLSWRSPRSFPPRSIRICTTTSPSLP